MTTKLEATLLRINNVLIEREVGRQIDAWSRRKNEFLARWEGKPKPHQSVVLREFDALVGESFNALLEDIVRATADGLADSPVIDHVVEYFHDSLMAWARSLDEERRACVEELCGTVNNSASDFQTESYLHAKAFRARLEQRRIMLHPDKESYRLPRARAVSSTAKILSKPRRSPASKKKKKRGAAAAKKVPTAPSSAIMTAAALKSDISMLTPKSWEEVGIRFNAEDSLRIEDLHGQQRPRVATYVEMGFTDGRKGDRPNILWDMLKDLIANGGEIDKRSTVMYVSKGLPTFSSKNVSRLSKILRDFIGIADSPFKKYDKVTKRYEAKFKILSTTIPAVTIHPRHFKK